jgi:hypothetical protein
MNCSDAERLIYQEGDGELPPSQAGPLAEHAAGCEACAAARTGLRQIERALRAMPGPARPLDPRRLEALVPPTTARPGPRRALAAAAIAALALAALAIGYWAGQSATETVPPAPARVAKLPSPDLAPVPAPVPVPLPAPVPEPERAPEPTRDRAIARDPAPRPAPAPAPEPDPQPAPTRETATPLPLRFERIDMVQRIVDAQLELAEADTPERRLPIMRRILADLLNECKAAAAERDLTALAEYVDSVEEFALNGLLPLVENEVRARAALQELLRWLDGVSEELALARFPPAYGTYQERLRSACRLLVDSTRKILEKNS